MISHPGDNQRKTIKSALDPCNESYGVAMAFRNAIDGLDKVIRTDILPPKVILVTGPPGSMKTSFCYTLMSRYLKDTGEFGLYTTLEETVQSHLRNMESLGVELSMNMQVGEVADLHVHGELDAKRFHIPQVGLDRLLKGRVQSELPGVLEISGHQRVAKRRFHGTGRPGDEDDFRGQNVGADHFFKSIDCIAEGHGHAV